MLHVCCMYAACKLHIMSYVCCMYAACMLHVCCICAACCLRAACMLLVCCMNAAYTLHICCLPEYFHVCYIYVACLYIFMYAAYMLLLCTFGCMAACCFSRRSPAGLARSRFRRLRLGGAQVPMHMPALRRRLELCFVACLFPIDSCCLLSGLADGISLTISAVHPRLNFFYYLGLCLVLVALECMWSLVMPPKGRKNHHT